MANPANQLVLRSVYQLFEYNFFIPSYQRGYRWTETQVKQLLDDIWQFSKKDEKRKGEFYCLQPIVVKQLDDKQTYEVIDGQQRLTTLFLIIKYFEDTIKRNFPNFSFSSPDYKTRTNSKAFLDYIKIKTEGESKLYVDYFHIWKAYDSINKWFEKKEKENDMNQIDFVNTLLKRKMEDRDGNEIDTANNVRVIWYEVSGTENDNPIEIFSHLNIGKIPLTNAELIKALFLQKENFFDKEATLKQIQIASEWDIIEKALQNNALWLFIYNSKNLLQYDNRIEYIFDLMQNRTEESEYYHTFNEFYYNDFPDKNNKPDIDKIWLKVKRYFLTFDEWFKNDELFHNIGYLIACGKDVDAIKRIKAASNKTKTDFKDHVRKEVRKLVNCNVDDLEYDDPYVRKILLLFNIQTMQNSNMRFPFDKYKEIEWDIEHIRSQTDKEIDTPKKRSNWIDIILEFFTGTIDVHKAGEFSFDNDEEKRICNFLIDLKKSDKIEDEKFRSAFELVQKYFGENTQAGKKDSISNLALLDATTNRSYGNTFFPVKRKRIIENDKNGIFVPLATKNVFLKYYSKKMGDVMYWKDNDANDYLAAIKTTLEDFLP